MQMSSSLNASWKRLLRFRVSHERAVLYLCGGEPSPVTRTEQFLTETQRRADLGLQPEDPTIADVLKPLGYVTGQFGKNHLGDRDEFLPTAHGFDEFFGNLYHLNAEQEPENPDYPKDPEFKKKFGPRGVLHCWANRTAPRRSRTPAR